jgi:DNA invertase Pin-like site-specific DNA recombinase
MARRRQRRRAQKAQRRAPAASALNAGRVIVLEAARVERLAYTRSQAAKALGIGPSTFNRRVLPLIETFQMPWGTRLIPVDELERLLAERRQAARAAARTPGRPGRKPNLPGQVVARIRAEHATGSSLAEIARRLNASGQPTSQGGRQWWPSTVKAVLQRAP